MRPFLATWTLIICLAWTGQLASANCVIIDKLDRLHTLQVRLSRYPNAVMFSSNIRQLRSIQQGMSNRETLNAVDGNSFSGLGADFMQLLQNTQRLLESASLDDPQSVRRHFDSPAQDNLASIGRHLIGLRCTADQIAAASAASTQGTSGGNSDAQDLAEVAETIAAVAEDVFQVRTLIIGLIIALTMKLCVPIFRRWIVLRLRKAKRYNTTYKAHYLWADRQFQGMLIDVNCYGTKLRHEPDSPIPPGTVVSIQICNAGTEGTVMWSNTHYSGVQFKRPIPLKDVDIIRSQFDADKAPARTQNGAPKGAV